MHEWVRERYRTGTNLLGLHLSIELQGAHVSETTRGGGSRPGSRPVLLADDVYKYWSGDYPNIVPGMHLH